VLHAILRAKKRWRLMFLPLVCTFTGTLLDVARQYRPVPHLTAALVCLCSLYTLPTVGQTAGRVNAAPVHYLLLHNLHLHVALPVDIVTPRVFERHH
jgi:hypothetical protein